MISTEQQSRRKVGRDLIWIGVNSAILLLVVQVIFIWFAPSLVPRLPVDFVRHISSCYRTLYHFDLSRLGPADGLEAVFGDSFSEGSGDEFLSGDDAYGIFRKTYESGGRDYLIWGRGGYGNLDTVLEGQFCEPLLRRFTGLDYDRAQVERLTFVFYEGNDLKDNIKELARPEKKPGDSKDLARFALPFVEYTLGKFREILGIGGEKVDVTTIASAAFTMNDIEVPQAPQSAALLLSIDELGIALEHFDVAIEAAEDMYPDARFQLLYLPSVASSYRFDGPFPVEGRGAAPVMRSGRANRVRSNLIRDEIEERVTERGWEFCDTTDAILAVTDEGVAVHGPRDWRHFNAIGYGIVADVYRSCFDGARTDSPATLRSDIE